MDNGGDGLDALSEDYEGNMIPVASDIDYRPLDARTPSPMPPVL